MASPSTQEDKTAIAEALANGAQLPMCNEYEKMISGMPFLPHTSPELQESKLRTRKLLVKFNDPNIADDETLADIKAKRRDLARQILRHMGDTNIEAPFFVSYGCNITIGDYSYGNMGLKIFDSAPVTIGDYVWIAPDVSIHTDIHSVDPDERREKALLFAKPVTIKDDCWIGAGAQIMPGVTIERGCTIGAGAVVTKDISEYSLAVGVPAKVVKSTKKNHSSNSAENHNGVMSKKVDQEWLEVKDREDDASLASCSKNNIETIKFYEGLHYFLTEFEEDGKKGLAWREGFERWRY